MRKIAFLMVLFSLLFCLTGCSSNQRNVSDKNTAETPESVQQETGGENSVQPNRPYTVDTKISEVINNPTFGEYGRLIFPVDSGYYSGDTLRNLRLTWYNNIDPD